MKIFTWSERSKPFQLAFKYLYGYIYCVYTYIYVVQCMKFCCKWNVNISLYVIHNIIQINQYIIHLSCIFVTVYSKYNLYWYIIGSTVTSTPHSRDYQLSWGNSRLVLLVPISQANLKVNSESKGVLRSLSFPKKATPHLSTAQSTCTKSQYLLHSKMYY